MQSRWIPRVPNTDYEYSLYSWIYISSTFLSVPVRTRERAFYLGIHVLIAYVQATVYYNGAHAWYMTTQGYVLRDVQYRFQKWPKCTIDCPLKPDLLPSSYWSVKDVRRMRAQCTRVATYKITARNDSYSVLNGKNRIQISVQLQISYIKTSKMLSMMISSETNSMENRVLSSHAHCSCNSHRV